MFKKVKEYFKGKNPYSMASAAIVIVSMAVICLILKEEMSEVQETAASDVVIEVQESETLEEVEKESETLFQAPDSEAESVMETQAEPTESVQSMPEPLAEQEEMISTEVIPDTQPEEEIPKEPEKTPEPEVIPEPEETPVPEEIPEPEAPHEHSWMFESVFQEPTCSNGGLENQICAHCGETRTVGGTPTGEHNYVVENEGDCCSEEIVRCSECNAREVREKDMSNHIDMEDGICYGCGYSK